MKSKSQQCKWDYLQLFLLKEEKLWVPHTGVKLRVWGFCCKAVGQWNRSTSGGVQLSGVWLWLSPSPCTAGLSECGLEFATLQTQTRSLLSHYVPDSLRASTSFIKGQYIKQSSSFSLIYIYFVWSGWLPLCSPLLRLLSIACPTAGPIFGALRQENWERATHSRKITFKTEKVVCSTCLKAAKSGLWDISPSPAANGKHQRDFIELSVFIAV